ncbi:hypothetical protein M3172_20615 [Mesobacillus subterraneus]|uniref:hypothetical protein n=1 Tax=Mesobacillus subterraneus TaxID=285983 RepID=UPI00204137BD|nr:hypothetical protein [Mesobacillus subterraneus]MCM3575599.1 hypothetical protein [Mesobacillus subterraneus]
MHKLFNTLFPLCNLIKANKIINKKIREFKLDLETEDFMSENMGYCQNIDDKLVQIIFDKTIENRKSLEEKAKTNILIVTVAITVILGLSSLLFSIPEKVSNNVFLIFLIGFLFLLSLIYMIIGSILSLMTLNAGELKEKYDWSPQDLSYIESLTDERIRLREKKYILSSYIELNKFTNFKLNNFASSTYEHIRNSLITFFLIGVSITLVFIFSNKESKDPVHDSLSKQNKIMEGIKLNLEKINVNIVESGKAINSEIDMNNSQKILLENQEKLLEDMAVINEKLDKIIKASEDK